MLTRGAPIPVDLNFLCRIATDHIEVQAAAGLMTSLRGRTSITFYSTLDQPVNPIAKVKVRQNVSKLSSSLDKFCQHTFEYINKTKLL